MRYFYCILSFFLLFSCSDEYQKKELTDFNGTWMVQGAGITDSVQFTIEIQEDRVTSQITQLNSNKWVKDFSVVGDKWVSTIERESNYQFKLKEKKIASDLFSLYDLSTSASYFVQFAHPDTICLSSSKSKILKSTHRYVRVK